MNVDVKLTKKQRLFCEEYLIDLNATRSYMAAGYSVKSDNAAGVEGHKLLRNPKIDLYLNQRMKEREKRTEITQDKVLKELAKIGFADIKDYLEYKTAKTVVMYDEEGEPIIDYRQIIDVIDSKDVDTSIIQEVSIGKDGTFKFKLYDKQKALVDIGKHLGMFVEKVEVKGELETGFSKLNSILDQLKE